MSEHGETAVHSPISPAYSRKAPESVVDSDKEDTVRPRASHPTCSCCTAACIQCPFRGAPTWQSLQQPSRPQQ